MDEIKKYWANLQARERKVISIGAGLLVLFVLYFYVWEPWHKSIANYRETLPQKRADLQWMKAQSDWVARMQGVDTGEPVREQGLPLLTVVEKTAQQSGLRANIKQMTPGDRSHEVKIWLSQVNFDKWLRWVEQMKLQDSIEVKAVDVQQVDAGIVEVRATLSRL